LRVDKFGVAKVDKSDELGNKMGSLSGVKRAHYLKQRGFCSPGPLSFFRSVLQELFLEIRENKVDVFSFWKIIFEFWWLLVGGWWLVVGGWM